MECLAAGLAAACTKIVDVVGAPICTVVGNRIDYFWNLEKHMNKLRRKSDELDSRKQDVLLIIEHQPEKKVKNEVKSWLVNVEEINKDKEELEATVSGIKCCKRASFGKKVVRKIEEFDELYQKGKFPDGLIVGENGDARSKTGSNEVNNVYGIGGIGDAKVTNANSDSVIRFGVIQKGKSNETRKKGENWVSNTVFGIGGIGRTHVNHEDCISKITFRNIRK